MNSVPTVGEPGPPHRPFEAPGEVVFPDLFSVECEDVVGPRPAPPPPEDVHRNLVERNDSPLPLLGLERGGTLDENHLSLQVHVRPRRFSTSVLRSPVTAAKTITSLSHASVIESRSC
ncbi:MAG: hypothetical protein WBD30_06365 [Bacteroidota bacterium]